MAEEDCAPYNKAFSVESQCVALSRCPGPLDSPSAPELSYPCGFDAELSLLKVCCPPENVTQPQVEAQPARFPKSGRPRRVEDKTELCSKWRRNEGCRLDKHFLISDEERSSSSSLMRKCWSSLQASFLLHLEQCSVLSSTLRGRPDLGNLAG